MNLFDSPPTAEENSERLAALVTQYGVGTKSYNSSAEKRELDRQMQDVTARYERGELRFSFIESDWLLCTCRSFRFTHLPDAHRQLLHGDLDWRAPGERRTRWEVCA